ncbi:MAG: hypothetical protein COA45_03090 [Zetaproteobacteria bacterium]|nr:MAG: hypothetical protein COA45_03090 [Zetaproteobacteria bacterium]
MTLMMELILYGIIALGVFMLVDAVFYFWYNVGDKGEQRLKKRLRKEEEVLQSYDNELKKHKNEIDSDSFFVDRYFRGLLLKSDTPVSLAKVYLIISVLFLCCIAIFNVLAPIIPFFIAIIASAIVAFGFPIMLFNYKINKRIRAFEALFPDAIDLIVRNLRIGRPLNSAINSVAEELPDPIGREFYLVSQDIAYGKNMSAAVKDMLKRISIPNLRFFVVAIQIQSESGGNLAEILDGLSKIIRGRFRLMRKVSALTAEGRFSAWFLSAFPLGMMAIMNAINPGYYLKVADHPYFSSAVVVVFILLIINVVAMRIITNLKV